MDKLHALRRVLGFPLPITSGYRCPNYNKRISKTGCNGPHTTRSAVDIAISGGDALKLIQYACNFHMLGIGVKQSGPINQRYIHIDDLTEKDGYSRPALEERLQAQAVLEKIKLHPAALQVSLNKRESQHRSLLVAGWRPFIGWVCGIGLANTFIINPWLQWLWGVEGPQLPLDVMIDLVIAMFYNVPARK